MKALKITTAVRMLCEMREKLEMRATENGRSLSGEIVFRLRKSLEQEQGHGMQGGAAVRRYGSTAMRLGAAA